jgi:signal transduction histidine kinase/CheY-like chemotaxis protein
MKINNYVSKLSLKFKNPFAEKEYNILRNQTIVRNCKWFCLVYFFLSLCDVILSKLSEEKSQQMGKVFIDSTIILTYVSFGLSGILLAISIFIKNIKIQKITGWLVYALYAFPIYHIRVVMYNIYTNDLDLYLALKFIEIILRALLTFSEIVAFIDSVLVNLTMTVGLTLYYLYLNRQQHIMYNSIIIGFQIIFSYIITRSTKQKLLTNWDLYEKSRYKNIFENMKSYFLYFSNKKIKFLNKIFVDVLMKNSQIRNIPPVNTETERKVTKKFSSSKILEYSEEKQNEPNSFFLKENSEQVLKILFESIKLNEAVKIGGTNSHERDHDHDSFLSDNYKCKNEFSLDEFIIKVKENYLKNEMIENFMFLGYKEMDLENEENHLKSEKKTFEVFFRMIIREEEEYEVIFNDISEIKNIEEKCAELKYKSLFLSKVAHEFKNPLICITELVNELNTLNKSTNKDNFNLKSPQLINKIQSMSDYLLLLIKDLDYFSNIQVRKDPPKLEIEEVELNNTVSFVQQIAETLIYKNNKKNVNLVIENGLSRFFKLKTDGVKLKQILINLISNAVKFTNEGSISLITKFLKGRNQILFEVKDSGIGLESEQIENLGNPFIKGKKLENSYGSGLGIYIVTQMLKQLDSELICSSTLGKGTSFSFILSSDDISVKHSRHSSSDSSNSIVSCTLTRKIREEEMKVMDQMQIYEARSLLRRKSTLIGSSLVTKDVSKDFPTAVVETSKNLLSDLCCSYFIVVDDEKFTRQSTLRILKHTASKLNMNFIFVEAEDGLECLNLVYKMLKEGKKINGIISDEMMNHMNGSTTAEIFKKIKNFNTRLIPFYLLTALTDFNNSYVDLCISKPLVEKEAIKILRNNTV